MDKAIIILLMFVCAVPTYTQTGEKYSYTLLSSHDHEGILNHISFDTLSGVFIFDVDSKTLSNSMKSKGTDITTIFSKKQLLNFIESILVAKENIDNKDSLKASIYESLRKKSTHISKFNRRHDSNIIDFELRPSRRYPSKCRMKGHIDEDLNEIKAVFQKYTDVNAYGYNTYSLIHIRKKD